MPATTAGGPGATLTIDECTVIGKLHTRAAASWPRTASSSRASAPRRARPGRRRSSPSAAGRLRALLLRAAGLDHAAALPLRARRRPSRRAAAFHVAALRRSRLRPAAPRHRPVDPRRRRRRAARWACCTRCSSRSAKPTCASGSTNICASACTPACSTPAERTCLEDHHGCRFLESAHQPAARLCRRGAQAGRRAARRRRQRADGDRRPAAARAGQRRARPRHGVVHHARRLQDRRRRAARCRSAKAGSMSTACSPRTMARRRPIRPSACSTICWRSRSFADPIPYDAQPYLPNPPALPTRRAPPRLPRRLEPRGHASRAARPGRERGRRRDQLAPADRLAGARARRRCRHRHHLRVARRRRAGLERRSSRRRPACSPPAPSRSRRSTIRASCRPPAAIAGSRTSSTASRSTIPAQPGAGATFKWSRENASVGSRVASMISAHRARARDARPRRRAALQHRRLGGDHRRRARVLAARRRDAPDHGRSRRRGASRSRRRCRPTCCPAAFPEQRLPRSAQSARAPLGSEAARSSAPTPSGTTVQVQDLDAAGSTGVINVPAAGTTLLLENGVTVSFASTGAQGLQRRRLLGVRRAHGRRLGRAARPRAAARHPPPLRAARHLGRRGRARSPTAAIPGRPRRRGPRLQLHRLRDAAVARQRPASRSRTR